MYSYPASDKQSQFEDAESSDSVAQYAGASRRISAKLAAAGYHLYALQLDAAHTALAENAEQLRALLKRSAESADVYAHYAVLYQTKAQRYADVTRTCFEIAAQTAADINHLFAQSMSGTLASALIGSAPASREKPAAPGEFVERRVAAQVIFFPERRAALQADEAIGKATENARQAAKKRRAA